jgi:hypothetical protein
MHDFGALYKCDPSVEILLSIELLFLLPFLLLTGGGRKAIISQGQGQGQTEAC